MHDQVDSSQGLQGWYNIHKSIKVNTSHKPKERQKYVIMSINAEKAFDKIQHPFMIKTHSIVEI